MLITFRLTWDLLDVVLCYVFEDTEAVIKMIIKGRSPTMRHVSRTHRVALDWMFERINLDPMIQIRYIDIKHQLADMFIKGNFTRDEWNNLLHLFYNQPVQLSLLCSEFQLHLLPKRWRRRCKNKKEKTGMWQNQSPQHWTWLPLSRQVPHPWTTPLRRKPRGYSKHLQRETWREGKKKFKTWRSVEFSRKAETATDKSQESWAFSDSGIMEQSPERSDGETCCVQTFRKFREF